MPPGKSTFLDKVLGRINRLDTEGLQSVVQRLARERTFLETIFNAIEDGILVIDEKGKLLYFNHAATRLLGLNPQAAEGQPVANVLPELDWTSLLAIDKNGGQHTSHHEFEVTFPVPRFLRLYAAPLDGEAKGSTGMVLILHDATEARQATFEAIESERIHSLTLLAASVAHEIGNPLNALHIHLQLMGRELRKLKQQSVTPIGRGRQQQTSLDCTEIAQKLENYLDVAKGEITRLDYIVTQFLQAIRPTPPQFKIAPVNDVIRETLTLLGPELENRGLHVKEKLGRRIDATPIDANQIKQVLVNLIKNAMQAMTKGGTLTVESGQTSDCIWFSISDTGGGIPQEQINHIFEPFYTTKKKGSGLGLMIVQRIVRQHGGRIEVESNVGQGTRFRIWLPLHEKHPRLLEAKYHD